MGRDIFGPTALFSVNRREKMVTVKGNLVQSRRCIKKREQNWTWSRA